jgi:hypothetical protein
MSPDLTPLARHLIVPPSDPARELALLDAFDAHVAGARPPRRRTAATAIAWSLAAGVLVFLARPHAPAPPPVVPDTTFVTLPGAELYPSLDHARVERVGLPQPYLVSLGLTPHTTNAGDIVEADVLVGQDGLARAIRLAAY